LDGQKKEKPTADSADYMWPNKRIEASIGGRTDGRSAVVGWNRGPRPSSCNTPNGLLLLLLSDRH
jgi:hypothetical protein